METLSLYQRHILTKWEESIPREKFSTFADLGDLNNRNGLKYPFHRTVRETLSQSMSFDQILNTNKYVVDHNLRRKQKWKELRHIYSLICEEKYKKGSIDHALWSLADTTVSCRHFVTAIMAEFKFDNRVNADNHLLALYLSFDGGNNDEADWRDILGSLYILKYFRLIKIQPNELILLLFNIYTIGEDLNNVSPKALTITNNRSTKDVGTTPALMRNNSSRSHTTKEDYVLENAAEFIQRIFLFSCESEAEVQLMKSMLVDLIDDLITSHHNTVTRRQFRGLLERHGENCVLLFAKYCWLRIPPELRLQQLDEAQLFHQDNAEHILMRHKLNQAIKFNVLNICRVVFREWKMEMLRESGVRTHIHSRKVTWRIRYFSFWLELTRYKAVRRQRRRLAQALGIYARKARVFARFKLYLYSAVRLRRLGLIDKKAKQFRLAGSHIREAYRLIDLRQMFHRWWNNCVRMINQEVAENADWLRRVRFVFRPWRSYAHEQAHLKRMEVVTLENKLRFDRMMVEAEEAAQQLMKLNQERAERLRLEELKQKEEEKERKLAESRRQLKLEKDKERRAILSHQREERRKRVKKEMKRMKKKYDKEWEERTVKAFQRAKDKINAFIESPENKIAIDIRFEKLKKSFFMNPSPETAERERILSSLTNIVLLYVQAKLQEDQLILSEIIQKFDAGNKNYLTYDEFVSMVRSTGTKLTKAQIYGCIRSIDADNDGTIDVSEIENAMKETALMGVEGSPWKMYVDPAENVLCFHNFQTHEKIFDYQMKDEKLREITIADMYGEADKHAAEDVRKERESDWDNRYKTYMVKRIQYMYRLRKARKLRAKKLWKIESKFQKKRTNIHKKCVKFLEAHFVGYKSRELFAKQLVFIFEKMYHNESKKIFWFNHHTKTATWQKPFLLRRYGDVSEPSSWIPVDVVTNPQAPEEQRLVSIHYYHVPSKKDIPRKPDGLPLCKHCYRQLAQHFCTVCAVDYCVNCHRLTHASPFGVRQKAKATKKELANAEFLQRLHNSSHSWIRSQSLKCQLCMSDRIHAGVHCNNCLKDLCRPCSRRLHGADNKLKHDFYHV